MRVKTAHGLGWNITAKDPRDLPMKAALPFLTSPVPKKDRLWHSDRVLNQGNKPACVGFSWAQWGICSPVEDVWMDAMGFDIYAACKRIDNDGRDGSSVRTGAKVMRTRGKFRTYFFAASVDEALMYVNSYGPVVFGTLWTKGMCNPSLFTKTIRPTGAVVGGHAYAVIGVQWSKNRARIRNSWSTAWGDKGDCWISISDLASIWSHGGEACAATEKELPIPRGGSNG